MGTDAAIPPSERRGRRIAWVVFVLALVALLGSSWMLALRIRAYNTANPRPLFAFREIQSREFTFDGRVVRITDDLDDAGRGDVIVTYADDELRLPVQIPSPYDLPGLQRHRDWLRVIAFAEQTGLEPAEFRRRFETGEIHPRMVIVVREPNAGASSDSLFELETDEKSWGWGEVMRHRWTFAFHELLPEGGFRTERLRFPESARSFDRRTAEALRKGLPPPTRDPDELAERTWQYDAAVAMSPRPPSITPELQALRNAGWTLPVASASVLLVMFSLAWALAPARRRDA